MNVVVFIISGCIGRGVVSPILGNQQLVMSGVLFTSARKGFVLVLQSLFYQRQFCCKLRPLPQTVLTSVSAELFEEGMRRRLHTTLSLEHLNKLFSDLILLFCSFGNYVCVFYTCLLLSL